MKDELKKLTDESKLLEDLNQILKNIGIKRQGSMGDIDENLNIINEEMEPNIYILNFTNDKLILKLNDLINKKSYERKVYIFK